MAPLEKPRACQVLQDSELNVVDGVMYCRPRGVAPGAAVPIRARRLLDALEYLAANHTAYRASGQVRAAMRKAIDTLSAKTGRGGNYIDADKEAEVTGEIDKADVAYFTAGGPPPVGAHVADLRQVRTSAELRLETEPLAFPHLFPTGKGWCPASLTLSAYLHRRLLSFDPKFQQCPEYTFYMLETWLRKKISGATAVFVGASGGADPPLAEKKAYAVLGKVPGTTAFLGQKRTHCMQMIRQLGRPDFFLTLTSHERQPHILAQCVKAHMLNINPLERQENMREVGAAVVRAYVNDSTAKWAGMTALQLCQQYPADVEREFMRQLESFLSWITERRQAGAAACPPHARPWQYKPTQEEERVLRYVGAASDLPCNDPWGRTAGDHDEDLPFAERMRCIFGWEVEGPDGAAFWDAWQGANSSEQKHDSDLNEGPPFICRDFVCRIEWQKRGFPHAHMLLWVKDWGASRDAQAAAAAARPKPRGRIAAPREGDSILRFDAVQLDALLRRDASVVVRPRNFPSPGSRWFAAGGMTSREVLGIITLGKAREVTSDGEWRAASRQHQHSRVTRKYRLTFLVEVVMVQELAQPLPYKNPGRLACGDHVFRPAGHDGECAVEVELKDPPQRYRMPARDAPAESSQTASMSMTGVDEAARLQSAAEADATRGRDGVCATAPLPDSWEWVDADGPPTEPEWMGEARPEDPASLFDVFVRTTAARRCFGGNRDGAEPNPSPNSNVFSVSREGGTNSVSVGVGRRASSQLCQRHLIPFKQSQVYPEASRCCNGVAREVARAQAFPVLWADGDRAMSVRVSSGRDWQKQEEDSARDVEQREQVQIFCSATGGRHSHGLAQSEDIAAMAGFDGLAGHRELHSGC